VRRFAASGNASRRTKRLRAARSIGEVQAWSNQRDLLWVADQAAVLLLLVGLLSPVWVLVSASD
jgi:hypothetical protein